MATSRAPPTVSVPVLSNITVCVRASASSGALPLTRIPRFAACATPAMKATGAAKMSGHGVEATKTASARIGSFEKNHAPPAVTSVRGSSSSANRSARRMKGAFAVCAALTIRTIPAYVLSFALAEARISKVSPALSEPLRANSPA